MSGERLEKALHAMPNINHGSIDKGAYRFALSELAQAVREAVESLRSKPVAGVEVKPLEWVGEEGVPGMDISAKATPEMLYTVRHLATNSFDVILNTDIGSKWFRDDGEVHRSYAEAKAAAEADYRQRILSTLSLPAQEPVAYGGPDKFGDWWAYPTEGEALERMGLTMPLYASPQPEAVITEPWAKLRALTFAVQHNPNCPSPFLVRLPGPSGLIDMKPYGMPFGVRHETDDVLGFGKTLDEAANAALTAAMKEA